MGLTKQYLKYVPSGTCNIVGSSYGTIAAVNDTVCAVTACENVSFYNLRKTEKVNEFPGSENNATALKFSDDHQWLAVGYSDGYVRLFHQKSDENCAAISFYGHRVGVNCLAFSCDGLILASGGKEGAIILWDIVNECGLYRLNGHKGSITHLYFTASGKYLISSSKDTFVKFWSLASQSCFYTLTDCRSEVYTFALVKSDSLLITGTSELEICVFDLKWLDCETTESLTDDTKKTKYNDGRLADSADDQENLFLRCKKRGVLLRQSKGRALQMTISSDDRILTCVGSSSLVDVYRIYSDEEARKRLSKKLKKARKRAMDDGNEAEVNEDSIMKDVSIVVARIGDYRSNFKVKWIDFIQNLRGTDDSIEYRFYALLDSNTVQLVSLKVNFISNDVESSLVASLDQLGHRTDVRGLAMAESGFGFVSGSGESAIVWNQHSLKVAHVLEDESMKDVTAVMFVTGDKHIITATKEGNVFLFELATNEVLDVAKNAHDASIWQLFPTADMKGFVSCSADKKIKFWMYELVTENGRGRLSIRIHRILELPDEVLCVSVTREMKFVAVGLLDTTARIYFYDSLKFFLSLYGHSLPITTLDISSDEKLVVTGSADKSIKIWGLHFGDCHKSLLAHENSVTCVQFVPKEHLFWSAGKDGLLKQWDADKFVRIQVLSLHSAEIRCLAQTTTGNLLISASHDKSIRLWELTEEIIVLQEEEENEREKEYEKKLTEVADVVPGENSAEAEADLAPQKTISSIKSAEDIIEAVQIVRNELAASTEDEKHPKHPMIEYLKSPTLDHFIHDVIQQVPSSHLEKSLLMIPFSFIPDILHSLSVCVRNHYKVELASRVIIFLIKIHHSYIISSADSLSIIDELRRLIPSSIKEMRDICGFNSAALCLLQKELVDRAGVKLFSDVSAVENKKKKKMERKGIITAYV